MVEIPWRERSARTALRLREVHDDVLVLRVKHNGKA
jgi:hypothetical protein